MSYLSFTDQKNAQDLLEAVQFISQKGWSPATSTNYSLRLDFAEKYLLSRSGVDKSKFQLTDFLIMNTDGTLDPAYNAPNVKSSAETEIHLEVLRRFPEVNCVMHTHSPLGTWLSRKHVKSWEIKFQDWELLKGLSGIETHLTTVILPIVNNHQDMKLILEEMQPHWERKPYGFLIAGHGLYTWGKSVAEAKRHVETFEFLFELEKLGAV